MFAGPPHCQAQRSSRGRARRSRSCPERQDRHDRAGRGPPSAVPPAESPSTRNSSLESWVVGGASPSACRGGPPPESTPLRFPDQLRAPCAPAPLRRPRPPESAFLDHWPWLRAGLVSRNSPSLVVDDLGDNPLEPRRLPSFVLVLALELRVRHPDRLTIAVRPFFEILLAGDREIFVSGRLRALLSRRCVFRMSGSGAVPETGQVGAPLDRVDVVAVGTRTDSADRFVVLQCDLDSFKQARLSSIFAGEHHRRMDRRLRPRFKYTTNSPRAAGRRGKTPGRATSSPAPRRSAGSRPPPVSGRQALGGRSSSKRVVVET